MINYDLQQDIKLNWNSEVAELTIDNILQNAVEALESKKDKRVDIYTKYVDNKIILGIKDYGCGMDEKTKSEAFIPGKSTKGVGENSRHRDTGYTLY